MSLLTALPAEIVAGVTIDYTLSIPDYLASQGWTLKLFLAGPGVMNKAAAAVGDAFHVTLTATETGPLATGLYQFAHRVSKAGEVHEVERGKVVVLPNLETVGAGDLASWEEAALTAVRAAIKGALDGKMASFTIYGRQVQYFTPKELRETEVALAQRVARRRGKGGMERIGIRFTRPEA